MQNKKFTKLISFSIICSMLFSIGTCTTFAKSEDSIMNFNIINDEQIIGQYDEEIRDNSELRYIVKYHDSEGERVEGCGNEFVNSNFDLIAIPMDVNVDIFVNQLMSQNSNIEYIQQDYKLCLFNSDDEAIIKNNSNIEMNINKWPISEMINDNKLYSEYEDSNVSLAYENEPIIAVIDSGIDVTHEALVGRIWQNQEELVDESDNDGNGYIDDVNGWDFVKNEPLNYDSNQIVDYNHGTHVAGIIVGSGDTIQGVCEKAKIMPLKTFKDGSAYTSDIIRAINYAESMSADIVNCSFGSNDENKALEETIENSGMLFVCAAGNKAKNIDESHIYPASYEMDNVIAVAASDNENHLAYFSNYGESIDIAAPGISIYSSLAENEYGCMSGTSMSAAYISGIAANIAMADSTLSALDIKSTLLNNAESETISDASEKSIKSFNYSTNVTEVNNLSGVVNIEKENSNQIKQIGAGGYHSVILVNDKVYTFGDNGRNQCSGMYYFGEGDFSAPGQELFVLLSSPYGTAKTTSVKKISTKGDHTLFLMADGTVRAMGANSYGQLGIGYAGGENITDAYEPTDQVTGLSNIIDIAAGHQFSLALDASGRIYAWGNNKDGQLGIGNTYGFFYAPQYISEIKNVSSISAGYYHALAITENSNIYGWGRAYNGALGDLSEEKYYIPQLLNIENADKIIAGLDNSFFIKDDKTVYAYGHNAYGQLGDGTAEVKKELIKIDIDNVADISTGFSTVFLKSDGTAYGCGLNAYGQLGIGTVSNTVKSITKIPGVYEAISVGGNHTLFLKNGELYSAGRNHAKQCGFEEGTFYSVPTIIPSYAKESFTVDNIAIDNTNNKLIIRGMFAFGSAYAQVYVGEDYKNMSPLHSTTGVFITPLDNLYSVEYTLKDPKDGINYGWIKVNGYPYKLYFSFNYDSKLNVITGTSTVSITKEMPYIFSINVDNILNIKSKIFTVKYDKSMLSLNDVCAQTFAKDNTVGAIDDTDIEVLNLTDSEIKFRTNKEQSIVSGIVDMIKFDCVKDGDTEITVTIE